MNANGLRFWSLMDASDWLPPNPSVPLEYTAAGRLRLKNARVARTPAENATVAEARLQIVPHAHDTLGGMAYLDSTGQVMATGAAPGTISIFTPPAGQKVTDFALGFDGIFYIAVNGSLAFQDRRGRWADFTLTLQGFQVFRLAPDRAGGVWVLNADGTQIGRVQGMPLLDAPRPDVVPGVMRPVDENTDPPRLSLVMNLPAGERCVALSMSPAGRLVLLSWVKNQPAQVRLLTRDNKLSKAWPLMVDAASQPKKPAQFPYSIAFVDETHIAVLIAGLKEALVYKLEDTAELLPAGDMYPLVSFAEGPFLHGLDFPPHFPTSLTTSSPLYPLSYRSFVTNAGTVAQRVIDSQKRQTEWHRIYLEAVIPAHCGIKVFLAAADERDKLPPDTGAPEQWFEHRFGQIYSTNPDPAIPCGAWVRFPSELPFHPGVLNCPPEKNKSGLFTVLVQRPGLRVRSLRGRYLKVKVELTGDGLTAPELASLRVYGSRFSFVKNYLPELYQETVFGKEADAVQNSTAPDFLERFIDNFEGVLTEIEDRVASSYLVTRAESTQEEALPWLASWIGLSFEPTYPKDRRRKMIQAAPKLFQQRGTLKGLQNALDVITGGMCSNGSIIIVEEYRLRRTFATILGAHLADENDPLLPGFAGSGNSYIGDTLFLGDEHHKEFLALFAPSLLKQFAVKERLEAEKAISDFYAQFAHRVTVLVHSEVLPQDFGLIRRVVELEKPAHVAAGVQRASSAFLVGIASLLGVDTYLSRKPDPKPVRVDQSFIGGSDLVMQRPSIDPRFEGATANPSGAAGPGRVLRVQASEITAPAPPPMQPPVIQPPPVKPPVKPPDPPPAKPPVKPPDQPPVQPPPAKPPDPPPAKPPDQPPVKPPDQPPVQPPPVKLPDPPPVQPAQPPVQPQVKPLARITAPQAVRPGDAVRLDAGSSEAPLGRKIVKYRWTLIK